jgi:hypothetical protein
LKEKATFSILTIHFYNILYIPFSFYNTIYSNNLKKLQKREREREREREEREKTPKEKGACEREKSIKQYMKELQ